MSRLPPFPAWSGPAPATPPVLAGLGYRLRAAVDADIPALRRLYADTRAEELAGVAWPPAMKQDFLDQQFDLQHRHYLQHHAGGDFLVIEHSGSVQGRYYLLRQPPEHLVIDVCLMAGHRGRGIGRALLEDSLREAQRHGRGMTLHVRHDNPGARRLYERLGFEACESPGDASGTHQRMRWPAVG